MNNGAGGVLVQINDIPNEVLIKIFTHLDWLSEGRLDILEELALVSKFWHKIVGKLCQTYINSYFPYLEDHQLYRENPLKLFLQECGSYRYSYGYALKMSRMLAALSGDRADIATAESRHERWVLNTLFLVNDHTRTLPEDFSEYDKKAITLDAFKYWAGNGQINAVKQFLPTLSHEEMTEHDHSNFGFALEQAALKGHLEIVKLLVPLKEVPLSYKERVLEKAASKPQPELIELLVPFNDILSSEAKGIALIDAAEHGHVDIVKLLLARMTFSTSDKGRALKKAAMGGHDEVVNCLAELVGISSQDIAEAMNEFAAKGNLDMVKCLQPLTKGRIWLAMKAATDHGHHEVVKYLLPHLDSYYSEDSSYLKGQILTRAALNGSLEIVKLLPLESTKIDPKDKGQALCYAAEKGDLEMVKYLWPYVQQIPPWDVVSQHKVETLEKAAQYGQLEVLKYVLGLNEIPSFYLKRKLNHKFNKPSLEVAAVIEENLNRQEKNKSTQKNASKLKMLKNFLEAPRHHPVKSAVTLGLLTFACAMFFSLTSPLMLSGLVGLSTYVVIRLRNKYINQAEDKYREDIALDRLFRYREKEDGEQIAFLNGCKAANSWTVYFKGFLTKNNWRHPISYGAGMEIKSRNLELR